MNEVYAFDAPAEQISKIEEISKSQTRLDQFQIKPHNLSYFYNWYNCFSLHKSSFPRSNQDFSTMQPQTSYSFKMKYHLNTTHTIYMSAVEKKLFIFSQWNQDNDNKIVEKYIKHFSNPKIWGPRIWNSKIWSLVIMKTIQKFI